ncbi:hypothetical protein C5167_047521 [Papaver somniferum]|uniref:Ubiquitin conjugation factor E4 core domain-containing protein n=1 Tax=Papaver somniferum TaxID=3469 RepID=A0A4Y7LHL4_PAPSO|nr:hypothetical protein C5167_047521 [Papaver somniferum]
MVKVLSEQKKWELAQKRGKVMDIIDAGAVIELDNNVAKDASAFIYHLGRGKAHAFDHPIQFALLFFATPQLQANIDPLDKEVEFLSREKLCYEAQILRCCPMELACMPEHCVEDAMELLIFASRIPRANDGFMLDDFMNFIIMFMGKMVEVLICWMPERSFTLTLSLLDHILRIAKKEEKGVYLNFLNFLVSESIFLLAESLNRILELKEIEKEMANTVEWERRSAQVRQKTTRQFHSQENIILIGDGRCRHASTYFRTDYNAFLLPEIVRLKEWQGPKKYEFHPKILLKRDLKIDPSDAVCTTS